MENPRLPHASAGQPHVKSPTIRDWSPSFWGFAVSSLVADVLLAGIVLLIEERFWLERTFNLPATFVMAGFPVCSPTSFSAS
jgi:hypothetical protein